MHEHSFASVGQVGEVGVPGGSEAAAAVETLCCYIESLEPRSALKATEQVRRRLDATDAKVLATGIVGPPGIKGGTRGAFHMIESAGISKNEQRRRVNRARAVAENHHIGAKMTDGTLNAEPVDAIARAARQTDGAAAHDTELIDKVASVSIDQASAIADQWVTDHLNAGQVQTEHDRQRRLRIARRTKTTDGLSSITLAGDTATIDTTWRTIEREAGRPRGMKSPNPNINQPGGRPKQAPNRSTDSPSRHHPHHPPADTDNTPARAQRVAAP